MRKVVTIVFLLALSSCHRSALPALFVVPEAKLQNESGAPMLLSSLHGRVAVYDFIFTRCRGTCPLLTQQMRALTPQFPPSDHIAFVSISVDPAFDRPAVLSAYAGRFRNDRRWSFLTGDGATIRHISVDGFKLAALPGGGADEPIVHSTKFVLVDGKGMIRGYYDSLDAEARRQLVHDAKELLEEL